MFPPTHSARIWVIFQEQQREAEGKLPPAALIWMAVPAQTYISPQIKVDIICAGRQMMSNICWKTDCSKPSLQTSSGTDISVTLVVGASWVSPGLFQITRKFFCKRSPRQGEWDAERRKVQKEQTWKLALLGFRDYALSNSLPMLLFLILSPPSYICVCLHMCSKCIYTAYICTYWYIYIISLTIFNNQGKRLFCMKHYYFPTTSKKSNK